MDERQSKKFLEANNKIVKVLKNILTDITSTDTEELMSSVTSMLNKTRKVIYSDDRLIHVKVDRRKNITLIRDNIQEDIEAIVGVENTKILFKINVANNMIIIKRRR